MLGVGQKFPEFNLTSVVSIDPKKAFAPFSPTRMLPASGW